MMNFNVVTYTFLCFFIFVFSIEVKTQNKYENEERIRVREVPIRALDFVDELPFTSKLKWYREIGSVDTTFEMKTKSEDVRYSVGFTKNGKVEAVEHIISWEDIPRKARDSICEVLSSEHSKFWIEKVQIHQAGSNKDLIDELSKRKGKRSITSSYEIVLKAKVEGSFTQLEYLFTAEGGLKKRSTIVLDNTDNLEY